MLAIKREIMLSLGMIANCKLVIANCKLQIETDEDCNEKL